MCTPLPPQLEQNLNITGTEILEENNVLQELNLTCGVSVERATIDKGGITLSAFTRFTESTPENRTKHIRLINQHAIEGYNDISLARDRTDALQKNTHTTWVMTDGSVIEYPHPLRGTEPGKETAKKIRLPSDVYTYERIPFEDEISTIAQVETALNTVLSDLVNEDVTVTVN